MEARKADHRNSSYRLQPMSLKVVCTVYTVQEVAEVITVISDTRYYSSTPTWLSSPNVEARLFFKK